MSAPIRFTVSVPNPNDHLLHVRMEVLGLADDDHVDLNMPVWSPGSYLIREYPRHVQNIRAHAEDGDKRDVRQTTKATWRVDASHASSVVVEYELFAHDLNVRANHVDDTHAFFAGVATYMYPEGRLGDEIELTVEVPDGYDWQVYTGLTEIDGARNRFSAPNFDVFFDAPVEMGDHDPLDFVVDGKRHRMVFWGRGNYDREKLARDLPRVVEANRSIFGSLPYDDYLFITLLSEDQRGGLEHLNSTALIYRQDGFRCEAEIGGPDDGHTNFLGLVCHEHFHVWNVKRIRPERLGPFDYQRENYTRDLWTVEGVTSYYDTLGLLRAELISPNQYAKRLADRIKRYEQIPGRYVHSVQDASFNAWVKLYRPDEHTVNSTVSYYLKGELICAMLDLQIRRATDGDRSLDDVLRHLWEHYYLADDTGYPEGAYQSIVEDIADADFQTFFDKYIRGTADFAWTDLLEPVGLALRRSHSNEESSAWLGVQTRAESGRTKVISVPADSPAHRAGLYAGDEIVAFDRWKIEDDLANAIEDRKPGDSVPLHVFRRGELRQIDVELGEKPHDEYRITSRDDASDRARRLLEGWLGTSTIDSDSNSIET
ncbi:MAG: M61 family metallopeptidase [Myxococcota bacterium]